MKTIHLLSFFSFLLTTDLSDFTDLFCLQSDIVLSVASVQSVFVFDLNAHQRS